MSAVELEVSVKYVPAWEAPMLGTHTENDQSRKQSVALTH